MPWLPARYGPTVTDSLPVVVTSRLILRPWRWADLAALAAIDGDPEVMRYIGDGTVRTAEETAAALRRLLEPPSRPGLGTFAVEDRGDGDLLGWVGLSVPRFLPSLLPAVEAGWRLRRGAWGRGIATEAARAALAAQVPRLDLSEEGGCLVSIRHPDNLASERVMAKLGFTRLAEEVVPDGMHPVIVYRAGVDQLRLT